VTVRSNPGAGTRNNAGRRISFTSNRSLEQVFAQELAYISQSVGTASGGDYEVDRNRRTVSVGKAGGAPIMRSAFREGLGCVALAPDQTFEAIDSLPKLDMPPPSGDPATTPWPDGDVIKERPASSGRECRSASGGIRLGAQSRIARTGDAQPPRGSRREDRFGDFILSSQLYTNARDLARFGLLYLQGGMWQGQRLLSEDWIKFVRTPAPAIAQRGSQYGGHWWLVPDNRNDVPKDAYSTAGNRGQFVIVVPSHDLVIVRVDSITAGRVSTAGI
jgi:hypothetical protein